MDEYVVGLEELGRASVNQAGAKGALLGEVLARGVAVPRGFCLTTLAYEHFLEVSGMGDAAREFHALPAGPEAAAAAEALNARITEAAIPPEVAFSLSTVYRMLGQRPRVAVRPSLAYEEMLRSPVSGHLEPHLNVSGEKDLFQAVRDMWALIWQQAVIAACQRGGIDHARLRPAVLIQLMIHPVCSGTIFTMDPGTGDRDRLVITAFWGMGPGMSGQSMPDTYHVDRHTMTLRYKRIVPKEVMVSANGIVPVPKNRRNSVVLKDAAIRELCTMAIGVEQIITEPTEIAWCTVMGGKTMVLEALPVGEIESFPDEENSRETALAADGDVADGDVVAGDVVGDDVVGDDVADGDAVAGDAVADPDAPASAGGDGAGTEWLRSE
jgi:pyruvate,water dikinase